jgi:hypothetical protein
MKTKDHYEYKPGMTLYYVYEGEVRERPTRVEQGRNDEYVSGIADGSYQVDAHYANKENAFVAASNDLLAVMQSTRIKMTALNKERLASI